MFERNLKNLHRAKKYQVHVVRTINLFVSPPLEMQILDETYFHLEQKCSSFSLSLSKKTTTKKTKENSTQMSHFTKAAPRTRTLLTDIKLLITEKPPCHRQGWRNGSRGKNGQPPLPPN